MAKIIKAPNFDNFTTSEVRSSYITLKNDPSLDPVVVRKKLYAELLKLVKKGWLVKKNTNKKGRTRFSKTKQFDADYLASLQAIQPVKANLEEKTQINFESPRVHRRPVCLSQATLPDSFKLS